MSRLWTLLALLLSSTASASDNLRFSLETGFPWTGAHIRSGHQNFAWSAGVESALFKRWEGYAGFETRLLDHPMHQVRLGATAGWVRQSGVLGRQGPQAALFIEWEWDRDKLIVPRILLIEKAFWASSTEDPDYQGLEENISLFTPLRGRVIQVGFGVAAGKEWLIEPAMRLGPVDGQFAIPGISIALRNRFTRTPTLSESP